MKLSDLPLTLFSTQPLFLTSANGKKGFIESTRIVKSGITWQQMVVIRWECGNVSDTPYPDECDKITVNLKVMKHLRPMFVEGLIRDASSMIVGLNELLTSLQE